MSCIFFPCISYLFICWNVLKLPKNTICSYCDSELQVLHTARNSIVWQTIFNFTFIISYYDLSQFSPFLCNYVTVTGWTKFLKPEQVVLIRVMCWCVNVNRCFFFFNEMEIYCAKTYSIVQWTLFKRFQKIEQNLDSSWYDPFKLWLWLHAEFLTLNIILSVVL